MQVRKRSYDGFRLVGSGGSSSAGFRLLLLVASGSVFLFLISMLASVTPDSTSASWAPGANCSGSLVTVAAGGRVYNGTYPLSKPEKARNFVR